MKIWLVNWIAALIFVPSLAVAGQELPPAWPWHGVSINGLDFSPSQLRDLVKKIHINSVQIRLLPRNLAEKEKISPAEAWEKSLVWGDMMLDECKQLGISGIMTVENFPIDPNVKYTQLTPDFWGNEKDVSDVIKLASDMGWRYAKRGKELVAYQVLSEPTLIRFGKAFSPPDWKRFSKQVVDAIRANDRDRWIAIAPPPWGLPAAYEDFEPLEDTHIIYGAHMYYPHEFTHQGIKSYSNYKSSYPGRIKGKYWDKRALENSMSALRNFQIKYQVPVWIGEFSAIIWADGGEQYIEDLASIFNAYGWSWTYFSLNGYFGWNPDFDNKKPSPINTWPQNNIGMASKRWNVLERIFNEPRAK